MSLIKRSLLLVALALNGYAFSSTGTLDRYILTIKEGHPSKISVQADLAITSALLRMSNFGPLPHKWPQYVSNLKALDENRNPIALQHRDSTAWLVDSTYVGQSITLHYDIRMEHEKENWPGGIDGVAFVKDYGMMASGRSLFIFNQDSEKEIEINIQIPDNWKVSTPWKRKENGHDRFYVKNQLQLQESLLFFGTHEEIDIDRESFRLRFVLGGGKLTGHKEQYIESANKVLDYYIQMMGGIPEPAPGNEIATVLVMINEADAIDGEVIGNNISLFLNPDAQPQEQIIGWFLFAHEFFHLWNGKSLRFENTKTDWFKEGISNYYTIKALHHAGLVNEEVVKMVMNGLFYNRYINDPGFGTLAPSEAASGFDKDNHWGLIYGGGLFAGICMDMEIRNNTENENSLDDLMRHFYKTTAGTDTLIGNKDILAKVNELGETDFTNLLNHSIHGTEPVPLQDYLKYAGIEVLTEDGQMKLQEVSNKSPLQEEIWSGFLGIKE